MADQVNVADGISFADGLRGFASFCESAARGNGIDSTDMEMVASKMREAAFVIEQLTNLRDGRSALGWKFVPSGHDAAIRRQALEDAARICDEIARDYCSPAGCASAIRALIDKPGAEPSYQNRVQSWVIACFGAEIGSDKMERGDRLLEEILELLQSGDYPPERVAALTQYVWSRPAGEPAQELGGVMVTLASYATAHGLDTTVAGETELARVWTKIEAIRTKQAAKPTGSALPIAAPDAEGGR